MRKNHRYETRIVEHSNPEMQAVGIPGLIEICRRCSTTREVIATVGIKYHRELRSYVRPDGVRFTGMAPRCELKGMENI